MLSHTDKIIIIIIGIVRTKKLKIIHFIIFKYKNCVWYCIIVSHCCVRIATGYSVSNGYSDINGLLSVSNGYFDVNGLLSVSNGYSDSNGLLSVINALFSDSNGWLLSWAASLSSVIITGLCRCTKYVPQADAMQSEALIGQLAAASHRMIVLKRRALVEHFKFRQRS